MKFCLWRHHRARKRLADEALSDAEVVQKRVAAQWPEVIRHVSWARETRQRNHLTDLFFDLRGGNS